MDPKSADTNLIEKYIKGKLTPAEVHDFENRLDEDREFARKYRLRKTFPEMMNNAGDVGPEKIVPAENPDPDPEPERVSFNLFKPLTLVWGAILVIIIGGVIFYTVVKTNKPREESTMLRHVLLNDSNTKPQVKQSDRITESQGVDSSMRKPIELYSPDDGMTFSRKDEILFRWELETDTFNYLYVFSEIHDKLVWWRGIKPGIRENTVPAINFLPGRYYWYVGNKDVKRTFIIGE